MWREQGLRAMISKFIWCLFGVFFYIKHLKQNQNENNWIIFKGCGYYAINVLGICIGSGQISVFPGKMKLVCPCCHKFGRTFAAYRNCLTKHCGIKHDEMITVRNTNPDFLPIIYVAVATNLSKRSKVPHADIIEKAKEFLGTEDE